MLCLTLSGALCHAAGVAGTGDMKGKDGTPISIIEKASHGSSEKGASIRASICGHSLLVVFTENLGGVDVEITTATGDLVQTLWASTPDGLQTYLPLAGDYLITFTLANGDEYYGEFTVMD